MDAVAFSCRYMHVWLRRIVRYLCTATRCRTFFKCSLCAATAIHHHCQARQELIADLCFAGYSRRWVREGGRRRGGQLTTAVARSAPRDVQLRTSVSTPNTIILQGHRATATAESRSEPKEAWYKQDMIQWLSGQSQEGKPVVCPQKRL